MSFGNGLDNPKLKELRKQVKELAKQIPGSDALTYGEVLHRALQFKETSATAAHLLDEIDALKGDTNGNA